MVEWQQLLVYGNLVYVLNWKTWWIVDNRKVSPIIYYLQYSVTILINIKLIHILLIFEMYIYSAKTAGYLNLSHLLIYINGIKNTKKKLCKNDASRRKN